MVYALLTLLLCYSLFSALENAGRIGALAVKGFAWLGRYTLQIYLYHLLIRDWLAYNTPWQSMSLWAGRGFFFVSMLFLPVLGSWLFKKGKKWYLHTVAGPDEAENAPGSHMDIPGGA